jgi:uncharacterized membrane protein
VARAARLEIVARVALVIVGLSPFLVPFVRGLASPGAQRALDAIFALVCHRNPARTLALGGALMPICSRCAGIFLGFVTGGLAPWPRLSVRACLGWGFVASVIMLVDVITQDLGLHRVFHPVRIATGVAWGHVMALGVLALARAWGGQARAPGPPRAVTS